MLKKSIAKQENKTFLSIVSFSLFAKIVERKITWLAVTDQGDHPFWDFYVKVFRMFFFLQILFPGDKLNCSLRLIIFWKNRCFISVHWSFTTHKLYSCLVSFFKKNYQMSSRPQGHIFLSIMAPGDMTQNPLHTIHRHDEDSNLCIVKSSTSNSSCTPFWFHEILDKFVWICVYKINKREI